MHSLEHQLQQWAINAGTHPLGSLERRQLLTQLVSAAQQSGKLWRGGLGSDRDRAYEDYNEALQKTWLYICRNINVYDPSKAGVMTWINGYLKWRLKDIEIARAKEQKDRAPIYEQDDDDPISQIPARWSPIDQGVSEPSTLLADLQGWLEQEAPRLQRIHIKQRPDLHSQWLIAQRLLLERPWKELAATTDSPIPTLSNFYQKKCLPLLRQFLKDQGYVD
jgi:hypothetical protein